MLGSRHRQHLGLHGQCAKHWNSTASQWAVADSEGDYFVTSGTENRFDKIQTFEKRQNEGSKTNALIFR